MRIFCNIGSLLLGLAAWVVPAAAAVRKKNAAESCAVSFLLCSVSLVLQLVNVMYLSRIGDFAAIDDTINAVVLAAGVLLAVAVIVNAAALARGRKGKTDK